MDQLKDFHEIFFTNITAAAVLIGFLFVALCLAPEKIFGVDVRRRAVAGRAFLALVNVFLVSLAGLLPRLAIPVITAIALGTIVQIVAGGMRSKPAWREFGFVPLAMYALQLAVALVMLSGADVHGALLWVFFGLYAYALGTAWNLLGGSNPARPA